MIEFLAVLIIIARLLKSLISTSLKVDPLLIGSKTKYKTYHLHLQIKRDRNFENRNTMLNTRFKRTKLSRWFV